MTSAADAVHKAAQSRAETLLTMKVTTSTTASRPFLRHEGVRERENNPSKDVQGSELELRMTAFADDYGTAATAITAIVNDFTADDPPLSATGFEISRVTLDQRRPVPSPEPTGDVHGQTAIFTVIAHPTP